MKNISRRVFIKGMAVAAVATAASTVLTGCKLPVTPEEPEVVPTPANSYTYTNADGKTVTVAATKYELNTYTITDNSTMHVTLDVKNGTKNAVQVLDSTKLPTQSSKVSLSKGDYYVEVGTIQFYGKEGEALDTAVSANTSSDFKNNLVHDTGTKVVSGTSESGLVRFVMIDTVLKEWASAKMTLKIHEVFENSSSEKVIDQVGKDIEFTFSK